MIQTQRGQRALTLQQPPRVLRVRSPALATYSSGADVAETLVVNFF